MDVAVQVIEKVGLPIACIIACVWFIYKLWTEANNRQDKQDEVNKEREKALIETNMKNAAALDKVADTIKESNDVNKELSETNKLLVEKVEDKLTDISNNVEKILERESSK